MFACQAIRFASEHPPQQLSVIATSSGAAAAYVRERLTNLRVAMFLELATTAGAITGAFLAGVIGGRALYVIFGLVLAYLVELRRRYNSQWNW